MRYKVMIGDIPCWVDIIGAIKNPGLDPEERFCPVCRKEIDRLSGRVMLINNYLLFPNISCHLKCFSGSKAKEIILQIKEDYERSRAAFEKALFDGRPWFSYIKI